jgi:hypothetical protein
MTEMSLTRAMVSLQSSMMIHEKKIDGLCQGEKLRFFCRSITGNLLLSAEINPLLVSDTRPSVGNTAAPTFQLGVGQALQPEKGR